MSINNDNRFTVSALNDDTSLCQRDGHKDRKRPKKKVLEEDRYTNTLFDIIKRDFFPDLPKIEAQYDYLKALERNDLRGLEEASERLNTIQKGFSGGDLVDEAKDNESVAHSGKSKGDLLLLDDYQSRFTSEDNASFEIILDKINEQRREKYKWVQDQIKHPSNLHPKPLLIESQEKLLLTQGKEKDHVTSESRENSLVLTTTAVPMTPMTVTEGKTMDKMQLWKYNPKNLFMYPPEGLGSMIEDTTPPNKKINHSNTRLDSSVFNIKNDEPNQIYDHYYNILKEYGKSDWTGPRTLETTFEFSSISSTPENQTMVPSTPLLIPGQNMTPLMTWGVVESTPLALEKPFTPLRATGPVFKIPPTPKREQISMSLCNKASQSIKKRLNMESGSTPSKMSTKSLLMSPAIKRIANLNHHHHHHSNASSRLDHDYQLRASYHPKSPYIKKDKLKTSSRASTDITDSGSYTFHS